MYVCIWVKDEKGFKHKNNKCNTDLNGCCFSPKKLKSFLFNLIAILFLFFWAKNKYHKFFPDLQKTH